MTLSMRKAGMICCAEERTKIISRVSQVTTSWRGTGVDDTLLGGGGDDQLFGGGGDDYLEDPTGQDFFDGGLGDEYVEELETAVGTELRRQRRLPRCSWPGGRNRAW